MVNRTYFRCKICKFLIIVRGQVNDEFNSYSFVIYCGNCSVQFKGCKRNKSIIFKDYNLIEDLNDQKNIENLWNLKESAFNFEVSPDFLVEKGFFVKDQSDRNEITPGITPFIRHMSSLKDYKNDNFEKYQKALIKYYKYDGMWIFVQAFKNLQTNKKGSNYYKKLVSLVSEKFPEIVSIIEETWNKLPAVTNFIKYSAIFNFLMLQELITMIPKNDEIWKKTSEIKDTITLIAKKNFSEFNKFLIFLKKDLLLETYYEKLASLFSYISNIRMKFLPIFNSFYYEKSTNNLVISTLSIEELLSFYAMSYEILLEIYDLFIFTNNLNQRNKFTNFKNEYYTYENELLFKSKSVSKGSKIQNFINSKEETTMNWIFTDIFENNIRNSISHNDYIYNPINQKISFKSEQMTLQELSKKCLKIIETIIYVNEVIWNYKKLIIMCI